MPRAHDLSSSQRLQLSLMSTMRSFRRFRQFGLSRHEWERWIPACLELSKPSLIGSGRRYDPTVWSTNDSSVERSATRFQF
jgi:hypothetical protein